MNFTEEEICYLYGLFVTDGYIAKQKNFEYLSIELQEKDKDLLEKIHNKCQSHLNYRTRDTNFKNNYSSARLTITDDEVLKKIYSMGFPKENKTLNAAPPKEDYCRKDFWRGVIDGDGSLGIRKAGPYLSLTTKSEVLKEEFVKLVEDFTGFRMNVSRNQRDNIYNLTITANNAKILAQWLYGEHPNLCLERKYQKSLDIENYALKPSKGVRWTKEEEDFIRQHSVKESSEILGRTEESIRSKIKRMKNKGEWK